jgi:phosphopantetheinyl transferase
MIYVYLTKTDHPWKDLCHKILAHHNINPQNLYKSASGKPLIKNQQGFISWAHSKAHVIITFSKTHAVGADCEDIRPINFKSIQKRYFRDTGAIDSTNDFFQAWTKKEALCKLKGLSIWRTMGHSPQGFTTHKITPDCVFCIASNQDTPIIWAGHYEIEKWLQKNL